MNCRTYHTSRLKYWI